MLNAIREKTNDEENDSSIAVFTGHSQVFHEFRLIQLAALLGNSLVWHFSVPVSP